MVLDALILNTDRHHENWGVVLGDHEILLAHSYDHASSLGRELLPDAAALLLGSEDRFKSYLKRGKGGLFRNLGDRKGANPLELCLEKMGEHPDWFAPWINRIRCADRAPLMHAVDRVPDVVMHRDSKALAKRILCSTIEHLTST
jgi:hypothetical protein